MDTLGIRQATARDAGQIVALYGEAGIEGDRSFTPEEAREHFAIFEKYPNYRLFVAELDGRIVGAYELLIMDNLAKRGRPSAVVEDVAVAPDCQGKGIGRALMLHARDECRKAGCYKLALSSAESREPAHRFYEALGFARHGFSFLTELE
jgi:GNAT superfamily N-acetyltransferase